MKKGYNNVDFNNLFQHKFSTLFMVLIVVLASGLFFSSFSNTMMEGLDMPPPNMPPPPPPMPNDDKDKKKPWSWSQWRDWYLTF